MSARHAETHAATLRGTKRTCGSQECGRRFYDLNKEKAACPYCGETFVPTIVKYFDVTAPMPRQKGKQYKLEAAPVEAEEVPAADIPEFEEADAPVEPADEIPEFEDEELDEGVGVVKEQDS